MSKYSWAEASAPGHMGLGRRNPPPNQTFPGGGPCAQGHGPMPMCPGAKALAHEYFDIWAHKYF